MGCNPPVEPSAAAFLLMNKIIKSEPVNVKPRSARIPII